MNTYTEYQKTLKAFVKLEKKVEVLDRANDPQADEVRKGLDAIEIRLSELSAQMEAEENK